jgi:POT family proton-dependent oligopeptide transporter
MNAQPARPSQTRSFSTIFLIELWERFGYYGMAAIFILFMVEKIGFADVKANLVWGAFTGLVYAAPAIGGWVGDNVLGTRRTLPIGAAILALGYLMLSIPSDDLKLFYLSMGVIVVGNGLFKANAANMVRRIYEGDDAKIDSAFTLYYMAVNIGSTVSMLLTPWIKDHWGWHAGFTVCCAGLLLGLVNYAMMIRTLRGIGSPPDEMPVRWIASQWCSASASSPCSSSPSSCSTRKSRITRCGSPASSCSASSSTCSSPVPAASARA